MYTSGVQPKVPYGQPELLLQKKCMKSFGLSCEDAEDEYVWTVRIKSQPANLGLPRNGVKKVYVCALPITQVTQPTISKH